MKAKTKGNIAMAVSKTFSGLNENALKYLVPNWMGPITGVLLRLSFGAAAFWAIGAVKRKEATPTKLKEKLLILLMGALLMFGYMFGLLEGLKYTTPITSSIFISLQPMIVFIISAIFLHERVTWMKVVGIIVGIGGALICVFTQKVSAVASDPMLGNAFCLFSAITYSLYLIFSARFLDHIDKITVSKWSFLGGALAAAVAVAVTGWDARVFTMPMMWAPVLALAFVLIFPTFISYFLLDVGLKTLSTTIVALYSNLILIVSTIVSYILGQDIFSWWQILAIVLILASVYFVEVAESKTSTQAKP